MTDPLPPAPADTPAVETEADRIAREKAARTRFFAIGLFRLSGALILVFGLAIAMQRFGWVQGQNAKIMGTIFIFVGSIQMILVPRLLLQAWRTPRP